MPAAITHFLHSQRVLAGIKQAGRETFSPKAFAWGAQGPDFFYCHRFCHGGAAKLGRLGRSPARRTAGGDARLHVALCEGAPGRQICTLLCAGVSLPLRGRQRLPSVCGIPGFPHAKENPPQTESVCHNEIESALDLIMLRSERGALPSELPLRRTVPRCRPAERSIASCTNKSCWTCFMNLLQRSCSCSA